MNIKSGILYACDSRFSGYYFEDSYVLSIDESERTVVFELECALTPNHPEYETPPSTIQHCYRRARLTFEQTENVNWKRKNEGVFTDALGEKDIGNIDSFVIYPNNRYELEGDWGALELVAQRATISLL